jgi:alkylation response protein AidB-like acyl-CoA dehydrogenase
MNFEFSADQDALREQVRKFLGKESPLGLSRQLMDGEAAASERRDAVWRGLAELGVTALMLPDEAGGIGLGAMELCVVAEEVGRQLSPVPLASTLYLAAQALLLGASADQQQRWLPAVAAGAVGCLAAPLDGVIDVAALPRFDGKNLNGPAALVADGLAAQWAVVLAADAAQQPLWVLARLEQGVGRRALATLDAPKPFAELRFEATPAEALDAVVDAPGLLQRLRNRAAVLLAFEQLGAADAALEMAAAYARERKAFGRAIGSYQGIKHKLADLYTEIQMARAHCYYGAWALAADAADVTAPAPELSAAAAAARVSASRAFSLMAQEGLHVHGGMGYTWELDCHLFLRRARQQAVLLGHELQWSEQLAAELVCWLDTPLPATTRAAVEGAMDFDDTVEEAAFRAECRAWLETHATLKQRPDDFFEPHLNPAERMRLAREWQGRKAAAGFGAITWPQALGGRGGTPMQELIWRQEEGRYNVPTGFFNVSLGMVIPSLMAHAAKEVLAQHIAPALTGQHLWCQLLSEPGAGSDLGMVRTRAERCDGPDGTAGWRLNGQKVWTSLAQFADFGLVLARSDPEQPKFDGMTTFFINMKSPGVTVRPIRQASGEAEFNEVFLEDVFVPDSQRVGAVNAGWKTTLTGLMSERLSVGGVMPAELWRLVAELLREARFLGASALADGRMRERLTNLYLNGQALWLLQCRALTALSNGRMPGPEMSGAKNVAASTLQGISAFAIDLQGPRGVLAANELGEHFALIERLWFGAAGMRIAGGTDEIVRNSIGERVLGLPGEPRTDKGVPFSQLSR